MKKSTKKQLKEKELKEVKKLEALNFDIENEIKEKEELKKPENEKAKNTNYYFESYGYAIGSIWNTDYTFYNKETNEKVFKSNFLPKSFKGSRYFTKTEYEALKFDIENEIKEKEELKKDKEEKIINIGKEAAVVKGYTDSIIGTLKKDFVGENIKEYYWNKCEKQINEKIWNYFNYAKDGWDKLNLSQKQEAFFEESKKSMILEDFSNIIMEYLQSRYNN